MMNTWRLLPPVLRNCNFYLLWQGQTISLCGNQAFLIAITFWLKKATASATEMAMWMALVSLPGLVLGPFAGAFADRSSRIRVIISCNLLAGVASLSLGLGMLYTESKSLAPVLFVALIIGTIRSFFTPAFQAAIPDLVPAEQRKAANSFNRSSAKLSDSGGQILSGVLYHSLGAPLLFVGDGLSYLFAGVSSKFIADTRNEPPKQTAWKSAAIEFLRETKDGLLYVIKDRTGMRDIVVVSCALNFISAPAVFLLPFYVDEGLKNDRTQVALALFDTVLGNDAARYGLLMAVMGIGAVMGHLLAGAGILKGKSLGWILSSGLLLGHVFLAAVGFVSDFWVALLLSSASSLTLGFVMVYLTTLLQHDTGRVARESFWLS